MTGLDIMNNDYTVDYDYHHRRWNNSHVMVISAQREGDPQWRQGL